VLLRYLIFHALGPIVYALWRLRGGRADIVQATQGQYPPADIAYAHFCHRAYLNNQWRTSTVSGPRRWARWLSHQFNAFFEAKAFARCQVLVVPSLGLARELAQEYPKVRDKIEVISNPVSLDRFARPTDFDRDALRKKLGFSEHDLVLSFMALGDFSRKGLGLMIEALGKLNECERKDLKLLVIGGKSGEIDTFRAYALQHGVDAHLVFVGMQQEVAPYLWMSDVFTLPSSYETFSLAAFQAAASGLPVMASQGLYGPEDIIVNGVNGWQVARDALSIHQWLLQLLSERAKLETMSWAATESVRQYSEEAFNARWQTLYRRLLSTR
jgi:glycosyltransferase involved in cell wall biosynthesis